PRKDAGPRIGAGAWCSKRLPHRAASNALAFRLALFALRHALATAQNKSQTMIAVLSGYLLAKSARACPGPTARGKRGDAGCHLGACHRHDSAGPQQRQQCLLLRRKHDSVGLQTTTGLICIADETFFTFHPAI